MPDKPAWSGLYVGLISGTSMDGIDAALVDLDHTRCRIIAAKTCPYAPELRDTLFHLSRNPEECTIDEVGRIDHWIAESFRDAALAVMRDAGVTADAVTALGSHGQTLRHKPRAARPFTIQLGDPNIIAAGTGITTVADFRRRDLAEGGEGAPLAPAFHAWAFSSPAKRVILNIGGFANVTVLNSANNGISGFDTGPGNSLMDTWCQLHKGKAYDEDGRWASSGVVDSRLLNQMLGDDYFALPPPKSTGFEYFDNAWLARHLEDGPARRADDVLATLCDLTACTIADAIDTYAADARDVLVCGGGVHNQHLLRRLQDKLPHQVVASTATAGVEPDWIEAAAFAWLAARRLADLPGNIPAVTGARVPAILGGVFSGRN
ncbi:anhydro-N-acetylmuramic acid kinase [Woeseia oceani]|nr:anhydro-N-acetylmuramic acid kinase [Woeseia oceani]